MKKSIIVTAGALAVFTAGTLFADDSMKSKPASSTTKSNTTAIKKSISKDGPVDRTLEIRVGPRGSWLDGDVRVGRTGTSFNVFDDLKLDGGNIGAEVDFDYQPINRVHLTGGLNYQNHDQSGTTQKNISNGENTLVSGATVTSETDLIIWDSTLGYDVFKSNTLRIKPYVGVLGGYVSGRATINGNVTTGANAAATARSFTDNFEDDYVTFFGGIDSRLNISRSWYVGVDAGGFGWDNVGVIHGQAYTGYDLSKTWGVRAGYTADYVDWKVSNNANAAEAYLQGVYLQIVAGF